RRRREPGFLSFRLLSRFLLALFDLLGLALLLDLLRGLLRRSEVFLFFLGLDLLDLLGLLLLLGPGLVLLGQVLLAVVQLSERRRAEEREGRDQAGEERDLRSPHARSRMTRTFAAISSRG